MRFFKKDEEVRQVEALRVLPPVLLATPLKERTKVRGGSQRVWLLTQPSEGAQCEREAVATVRLSSYSVGNQPQQLVKVLAVACSRTARVLSCSQTRVVCSGPSCLLKEPSY